MHDIYLRVKLILQVESNKEELLQEIVKIQYESLSVLIGEPQIPATLSFIVVETAIARYNRLGSEGLTSEAIDVINQSFTADLFEPYSTQINAYLSKSNTPISGKLKLL